MPTVSTEIKKPGYSPIPASHGQPIGRGARGGTLTTVPPNNPAASPGESPRMLTGQGHPGGLRAVS